MKVFISQIDHKHNSTFQGRSGLFLMSKCCSWRECEVKCKPASSLSRSRSQHVQPKILFRDFVLNPARTSSIDAARWQKAKVNVFLDTSYLRKWSEAEIKFFSLIKCFGATHHYNIKMRTGTGISAFHRGCATATARTDFDDIFEVVYRSSLEVYAILECALVSRDRNTTAGAGGSSSFT